LFSDLASENTELLTSLAGVLKNLFTPLHLFTKFSLKRNTYSLDNFYLLPMEKNVELKPVLVFGPTF
jgi:hypothetical protein